MQYAKDIAIITLRGNKRRRTNKSTHTFECVTHTHSSVSTMLDERMKVTTDKDYIGVMRMKPITRKICAIRSPLRLSVRERRDKYCKH